MLAICYNYAVGRMKSAPWHQEYIPPPPPSVQCLIQLCIGSWSSVVGSSDVIRTLHTSARPVSRQGTVVFDPRVPATPWVPLRCVRYDNAKIRLRSTNTLCRAGSGVAYPGELCTLDGMYDGVSFPVYANSPVVEVGVPIT